jgi:rubrerythrin
MDTNEKSALVKIYKEGLEMEIKGYEFYTKAEQNTHNTMSKTVFGQLKTDEIDHMKKIKEIYDSLEKDEIGLVVFPESEMETSDLKKVFVELALKFKEEIKVSDDDLKAIDVGIAFEAKAIDFYDSRLKEAKGEKEKSFCRQMLGEERTHHIILVDMKEYYTDPAAWMLNQEHALLD